MPFAAAVSTAYDARQAVDEVCLQATSALGGARPDVALAFYSPHHIDSAGPIARLIHGKLQPGCLIGCVGESIVGNAREIEQDPALSLWLGNWNGAANIEPFRLQMSQTPDGFTLLGWPDGIIDAVPERSLMLTLGDPYTFPMTEIFLPRLNEDSPGLAVIGGMASNPMGASVNNLIFNDDAVGEGAVGVLLQGDFHWRSVVSQGCRPIGRPLVVTKGQENVVVELSGKSPLDYLRSLHEELGDADRQLFERGLLIGVAISEYRDTFGRGDFIVRNLLGVDRDSGAMAINDRIRIGQTVQFQVRDAVSADEDLQVLLHSARTGGLRPAGGLLFTCNGRGTRLFSQPNHDAQCIQHAFGPLPLAGFFAAGELGPVSGKNFIHGFTASALLFE
jgi:small ligand-binding sensory domain FIST